MPLPPQQHHRRHHHHHYWFMKTRWPNSIWLRLCNSTRLSWCNANFPGKYNPTIRVLFEKAASIVSQFKQYKVQTACLDTSHVTSQLGSNCQAGPCRKRWGKVHPGHNHCREDARTTMLGRLCPYNISANFK